LGQLCLCIIFISIVYSIVSNDSEFVIQETQSSLSWKDNDQQCLDADKIRNPDFLSHYCSYDCGLRKIKSCQLQKTQLYKSNFETKEKKEFYILTV